MRTLITIIVLALSATAQIEGNPDNWCRAGFFTRESGDFRIATVSGERRERVHFYNDFENDCPQDESCKGKAYVIPGDRVIVSRTYKDFGCVWFAPARGMSTTGWVRLRNLKFTDSIAAPRLTAWLGEWRYAENSIKFTKNKLAGWLNVTGDALWRGVGENVHIGELDDRVRPDGNLVKIGEGDADEHGCKVEMRLVGEFLLVSDNLKCGGMNVSFSGVYLKKKR